MKSFFKNLCLVFFTICCFGFFSCSKQEVKNENGWFTNYDACLKQAQNTNKKVFLLITRDETDNVSKELKSNLFNTEEFISTFSNEYEFCQLDVSPELFAKANPKKDADKQVKKESSKYKKLLEHRMRVVTTHNVQFTPSLYIVTKEGYVLFDIAYLPVQNVQEFSELLDSYKEKIEPVEKLVLNVQNSTGLEKIKAIDELYEKGNTKFRYQMTDLMRFIVKNDKKDESGLLGKYVLAIATSEAMDAYIARKPENISKVYEKAAKNSALNDSQRQQAYYAASYVLMSNMPTPEETVRLIDLLQKAVSVDKDSEIGLHCADLLEKVQDFQKRQIENEKKAKQEKKSSKNNENSENSESDEK